MRSNEHGIFKDCLNIGEDSLLSFIFNHQFIVKGLRFIEESPGNVEIHIFYKL